MSNKWSNLISGSDIRGIAIKTDTKDINLTDDIIKTIGFSFSMFLSKKLNKDLSQIYVAIGMDSRITNEKIKDILIKELNSLGVLIYDCGLCSTPAMFMSTLLDNYNIDGAIEITASHLPYYFNGLKFFTKEGGLESTDIKEMVSLSDKAAVKCDEIIEKKYYLNLMNIYSESLSNKIIKEINDEVNYLTPLKGFKIVVDAGNGVGGFYAKSILEKLGADTTGSQFLNPDGLFPNHIPNPENNLAMASLKNAVLKNKADLGIIFDTDVDRAAIVDSNGCEINRNSLIALISAIILEEYPYSTIVTDSVTSDGLSKFITTHNGIHRRFKRGYKNVINEALRLNKLNTPCHIAIETSGHCALSENYFQDDGAYLITKIIIKMAKLKNSLNLSDLIKDLEVPADTFEYRLKVDTYNINAYWEELKPYLYYSFSNHDGWSIDKDNIEGIRVICAENSGNGCFLIRCSLHEPLLVVNIESNYTNQATYIFNELGKILNKKIDLEYSYSC